MQDLWDIFTDLCQQIHDGYAAEQEEEEEE